MHTFQEEKRSSKTIFEGRVFTVTLDEVRLENGKNASREVVHHIGGCGVLAINTMGEIALVRQYRYAAAREMLEIPAGKVEPGEPTLETARRELREEAGQLAGQLVPFGQIWPTCAYCTEVIHLFLATQLTPCPQQLDEDEFLDVLWLPLEEVANRILRGEIDDAKTVSAVLRAQAQLASGALRLT